VQSVLLTLTLHAPAAAHPPWQGMHAEDVLFAIANGGARTPAHAPGSPSATAKPTAAAPLLLVTQQEGPLQPEEFDCGDCGKRHTRYWNADMPASRAHVLHGGVGVHAWQPAMQRAEPLALSMQGQVAEVREAHQSSMKAKQLSGPVHGAVRYPHHAGRLLAEPRTCVRKH
jgi:hypothetical protein